MEAPTKATDNLSFSEALRALKAGQRVCRSGWNGKGMWLALIKDWALVGYEVPLVGNIAPFVAMKTADDKFVPWLCSPTDMLAEDWMIVKPDID